MWNPHQNLNRNKSLLSLYVGLERHFWSDIDPLLSRQFFELLLRQPLPADALPKCYGDLVAWGLWKEMH